MFSSAAFKNDQHKAWDNGKHRILRICFSSRYLTNWNEGKKVVGNEGERKGKERMSEEKRIE